MNTITALRETAEPPASVARLSVEGLIVLIWSRKLLFAAVTVLFASLIVFWAFDATPIYRVETKIMPRQAGQGGGLQELLGQFGGLADMAGLNFNGSGNTEEYIALLRSRALFETFVKQQNLMPILFSGDWDPATRSWKPNLKSAPTMDDAWGLFDHGIRRVEQNQKTRVITLQISWKNRQQAAAWANELVRLTNEEVRQRALHEAQASLSSLQEQLRTADHLELRDSIYRLMEVQVNREVLAKSRPDYAFTVLDPAVVPDADHFASPRRRLLIMLALPFGMVMGALTIVGLQMTTDFVQRLRRLIADSR